MAKTKGEGWVEYMWANPATRSLGKDHLYLPCAARTYTPAPGSGVDS